MPHRSPQWAFGHLASSFPTRCSARVGQRLRHDRAVEHHCEGVRGEQRMVGVDAEKEVEERVPPPAEQSAVDGEAGAATGEGGQRCHEVEIVPPRRHCCGGEKNSAHDAKLPKHRSLVGGVPQPVDAHEAEDGVQPGVAQRCGEAIRGKHRADVDESLVEPTIRVVMRVPAQPTPQPSCHRPGKAAQTRPTAYTPVRRGEGTSRSGRQPPQASPEALSRSSGLRTSSRTPACCCAVGLHPRLRSSVRAPPAFPGLPRTGRLGQVRSHTLVRRRR
mmetsp:Transcript_181/g.477  ORF Transcript_181/g.477 Transcript_181/m.477 type:complete len:274 (+) Transcript_181:114-935(+)